MALFTSSCPNRHTYPHRRRGSVLLHCRGGRSRSVILASLYIHIRMPDRFPSLEAAIDHLRVARELHPDEWDETPKPMLTEAARHAATWIRRIEADKHHDERTRLRRIMRGPVLRRRCEVAGTLP